MSFFTLSGTNVDFLDWELWWKTYTTKKAFPTTRRIELVGKKEFATAALNSEHETFIVHVVLLSFVASPNSSLLDIHLFYKPQIAGLIAKEAPIKIFDKYIDFANAFSLDLAFELPKDTGINDYAIKLVDGQQPS